MSPQHPTLGEERVNLTAMVSTIIDQWALLWLISLTETELLSSSVEPKQTLETVDKADLRQDLDMDVRQLFVF